jgi:hypothetical protein
MKKLFTLFIIFVFCSVLASAEPDVATIPLTAVRMSVTSPIPNTSLGAQLTVNLLKSDGSDFSPASVVDLGASVTTNEVGVLSFVLEGSGWGYPEDQPYNPNYLVRVTYGGVVLCIERLEIVYSKQGLYGAYISPNLISPTQDFKFHKIGILENDPKNSQFYTYFQGGDQEDNVTYTLPTAAPASNGQVLTSTTDGGMSWTTPATGGGGGGISVFGYGAQLAMPASATVIGSTDVTFSNNGALMGVTHTAGTTTFTVPSSGVYKIEYSVSITLGVGSAIALAVNNNVQDITNIPCLVATGQVSGTAILTLSANDVITLRNNSAIPFTLTLAPGVGAQISIINLNSPI